MKRLYRLFLAFAIFDLLTISVALLLDRHALHGHVTIATSQQERSAEQSRHLANVRRWEFVVAGLMSLGVVAVMLHRRRMLKELEQRDEELRRLNTAFEDAIAGIA